MVHGSETIHRRRKIGAALGVIAMLSACGGGGGGGGGGTLAQGPDPTGAPPPPPPSGNSQCSLPVREQWASSQLDEWYLFPETLPADRDGARFSDLSAYIDYLTATARSQGRDRYFTYLTSIADENAFYQSGANAGFGIRLSFDGPGDGLYVSEAFEGAPALQANIDRGAQILAIGNSQATLRNVSDIIDAEGQQGVIGALGPSTAGTTRTLRVKDASGTRVVTLTKADYSLDPVSSRYGARILTDGNRKVGYLNLRTFIEPAESALVAAFSNFKAQGVTDVIIDLRYNGGGLIKTAELLGDLLGDGRNNSVFDYQLYRPSKAGQNRTRRFDSRSASIAPQRIAFIGTGATASASELLINAMIPYYGSNVALIGANTYGKPVGQIAEDRSACDDRLRIIAFAVENADHLGGYYDGLAGTVEASCQAGDDVTFPLGDPRENSVSVALDFLAGRTCTPIAATTAATGQNAGQNQHIALPHRIALMPRRPTPAQVNSPGIF